MRTPSSSNTFTAMHAVESSTMSCSAYTQHFFSCQKMHACDASRGRIALHRTKHLNFMGCERTAHRAVVSGQSRVSTQAVCSACAADATVDTVGDSGAL